MGVKELWTVLTPYAERKPIHELRGKTVAIDLAGWVCESLNVVDYFVQPYHHLKNLFFRTCYLIWEDVTPVFVLEGKAPQLKSNVIAKRNELQFRGAKPRQGHSQAQSQDVRSSDKGRTRFTYVLRQCEQLLLAMGIVCVEAPGEAEAYCAFLNKKGLVDGVISQDSDCFGYGALRVYRNFSVSTQGAQAAAGGSVDIYDMRAITEKIDFGQNKVIAMALLCGCDYCPEGVGGIGRDGVMKLFSLYKESEILPRIKNWRTEANKYNALELRVDDKNVCTNCGHIGRAQKHMKSGCGICRTTCGCDETLWKEQRLMLKAELSLRKKALLNPSFPSEEIISEFVSQPEVIPDLNTQWRQPNIAKFMKQSGHLLQWPEIYCFQKFFPILTRWHVFNSNELHQKPILVEPKAILKKRTVRGVPSLELLWKDAQGCLKHLIPEEQIKEYEVDHPKGIDQLFCTIEPVSLLEAAYPVLVASYLKSKEKPKKQPKRSKAQSQAFENMEDLILATQEVKRSIKKPSQRRRKPLAQKNNLGSIEKFFPKIENTPKQFGLIQAQCSTPIKKNVPSDLESDCDASAFDMSGIIDSIVTNPLTGPAYKEHAGHALKYETYINPNLEELRQQSRLDDADLLSKKRNLSMTTEVRPPSKRASLDDSFDLMVKSGTREISKLLEKASSLAHEVGGAGLEIETPVQRFKMQQHNKNKDSTTEPRNISQFFDRSLDCDAFEQIMDISLGHRIVQEDFIVISESD